MLQTTFDTDKDTLFNLKDATTNIRECFSQAQHHNLRK